MDFLTVALGRMIGQAKKMIDKYLTLSMTLQPELLDISRSNVNYLPCAATVADLAQMRCLDELQLNYPLTGARMLRDLLGLDGMMVGRRHVTTLIVKMGFEDLPQMQHLQAAPGPSDLSVPVAGRGHLPSKLDLRRGFDIYSDATRIRLSWRHRRLGDMQVLVYRVSTA
jgi:hypothetical protein